MMILVDIGLSFLLGILFIASYILVEKIRSLKIFFRWSVYKGLKLALEGTFYSFLIWTFVLIFKTLNSQTVFGVFVVSTLTLILLRNYLVALFGLIIPLVYESIINPINFSFYISLILLFIFLIVIEVIKYFFDDWFINFNLTCCFLLIAFFTSFIFDIVMNQKLMITTFEMLFMPYLGLMIVYAELQIALKFLISANILYKSVNFNFSQYYRESLKSVIISDLIVNKKLQFGLYGVFKFTYPEFEIKDQDLEIKESILLDLEKSFPINTLFFLADEKHYGFFYPLSLTKSFNLKDSIQANAKQFREIDDNLKFLENIIHQRNVTYLTSWKEKVQVKVQVGLSLYGIHSNSINDLHHFAEFALYNEQNFRINVVQLFCPLHYFEILKNEIALNQMDARIGLDNFINYFIPVNVYDFYDNFLLENSTQNLSIKMYWVKTDKIEYSDLKESIRDVVNFLGWEDVFDRYVAFWALVNSQNLKINSRIKLSFFYSSRALSTKFNLSFFQQRIEKFGMRLSNIILVLDPDAFMREKNQKILFENIQLLINEGVEFGIIKPWNFIKSDLINIQPNFLFLINESDVKLVDEFKILFPNLKIVQIYSNKLKTQEAKLPPDTRFRFFNQ